MEVNDQKNVKYWDKKDDNDMEMKYEHRWGKMVQKVYTDESMRSNREYNNPH